MKIRKIIQQVFPKVVEIPVDQISDINREQKVLLRRYSDQTLTHLEGIYRSSNERCLTLDGTLECTAVLSASYSGPVMIHTRLGDGCQIPIVDIKSIRVYGGVQNEQR